MKKEKLTVKLKNIYLKEVCKDFPLTSTFYRTGETVKDFNNEDFEVVQRGKSEFYVDIPVGQNDIGLSVDGYFVLIGKAHTFTRDFKIMLEQRKVKISKMKVREESKALIQKHKDFHDNLKQKAIND